jgi:hypothetical protein
LSNHLGNVLATVSDRKIGVDSNNDGVVDYYTASVVTANDYAPYGMILNDRQYNQINGAYRYGFNGQEKSTEIGVNTNTAEFWEYDSRIARRWNIDPHYQNSPYSTLGGNPAYFVDPNGEDTINVTRTRTTQKIKGHSDPDSDILATHDRTLVNNTASIDIKIAKGPDVFNVTDVNIVLDEDGSVVTKSSKTTTLDIRGENSGYRLGGRNLQGYLNDTYAAASLLPPGLLSYYANKNKGFDWPTSRGLEDAKALQSDVPFAFASATIAYSVIFDGASLFEGKIGSTLLLKPLGLGSTGRIVGTSLTEELAMEEIMSNPSTGRIIKEGLKDARWNGWTKMSNGVAHGIEIHYNALWENGAIKAVDDFKYIGK